MIGLNNGQCHYGGKFMLQDSFSESGLEKYLKKTRKEQFLEEMESFIPCKELTEAIEQFYPKPKGVGRRPTGFERVLRIHFLQHGSNLSDPASEEALYDSHALRQFVGVELVREPVPDGTTVCKFRFQLSKKHQQTLVTLGPISSTHSSLQ